MVRGKQAYNIAVARPFLLLVVIPLVCVLGLEAETSPLRLPASACKNGTATAAMPLIAGATYAWGQVSTATVNDPPPSNAIISWSIIGGQIISGQGTAVITWKAGDDGTTPKITCTYSYGNSCPQSNTAVLLYARALPGLPAIKTMPVTFKAGQNTSFVVTHDKNDLRTYFVSSNANDRVDLMGESGDDLTFMYRSVGGPGPVSLKLVHVDYCENAREVPDFIKFTLEP